MGSIHLWNTNAYWLLYVNTQLTFLKQGFVEMEEGFSSAWHLLVICYFTFDVFLFVFIYFAVPEIMLYECFTTQAAPPALSFAFGTLDMCLIVKHFKYIGSKASCGDVPPWI